MLPLGFLLWWWFGGIYHFRKNWHVACFVDLNLFDPFRLDRFFFLDDLTGFEITKLLEWLIRREHLGAEALVPRSVFLGNSLKKVNSKLAHLRISSGNFKVVVEVDEDEQTLQDKWKGLAFDTLDDQYDITPGKGMVDSLFQAPMGLTFKSSNKYLSQLILQQVDAIDLYSSMEERQIVICLLVLEEIGDWPSN